MAYYNKIGLLVLNKEHTKMMVLKEYIKPNQPELWMVYKVIWWTIESWEQDIECLIREVYEEIGCEVDKENLVFIHEYLAPSASDPAKDVSIRLYQWSLIWNPYCNDWEALDIVWIDANELKNSYSPLQANPILKDYILPDLITKNIII